MQFAAFKMQFNGQVCMNFNDDGLMSCEEMEVTDSQRL